MAVAFEELPEELRTLILLKLPVKSLLRFKCVQKSWYSLINSPYFISLHRTSTKKNNCFLVRRYIEQQHEHVLSLHSYETLELCGNQINLPLSFHGDLELCGSCDGLVCITNKLNRIIICNPTIREFRSLSVPPSFGLCYRFYIESVAFGSDPNTGQYKVLVIGVQKYGDPEARLYDSSSDSWRETAVAIPPGPFRYWHRAVSFNGAFHWCPYGDHDSSILTFHISNEVTGSIPLPDFPANVYYDRKELFVSSKSQLLSIVLDGFEEGRFEISVMTEYGVKESWTRLFNIMPLLPDNFQPIIPFWDEQRLLLINVEEKLVSFDLQHHQNLGHFPSDGDFDLCPYSQSLVSVNGIGNPIL